MFKKKYTGFSLFAATALAAVNGCMVGQTRPTDEGAERAAEAAGGRVTSPTGTLTEADLKAGQ